MNTSTPETIQMFWASGSLSTLERLSIASFLANGHAVHLYTYGLTGPVPAGTTLLDAGSVLPETECRSLGSDEGFGSLAPFSNRFRYKLLLEKGGVWSDSDIIAVKPLSFLSRQEYFFATEYSAPEAQGKPFGTEINSCMIKVPPGSALMRDCLQRAEAINADKAGWGATGVLLVREAVARHNLGAHAGPPNWVSPVPFWEFTRLLQDLHTLPSDCHAIHFYNEMFRRNFFDKDARYEPHCVYERLKAHYLKNIQ
ncbi:MAG: hypothetical protein JSR19_06635 [Proteobacteria bacterium]|nr:hypothetical protein [Pseudomonadota bacterium]HQR04828.1 glycosyltransferase [Rhodocyclaceae bacterium]